MRVLLMVTNAVFLVAVAQAGHKRVIIKVPQRIKHIYHHQVKRVPVYVVVPEKKSKVLDDLEEVTKVLPCKEHREREPPWQDDIAVAAAPRYRYAKSYRDQTSDSVYLSEGDSYRTSISDDWQQDVKRSLQPPPPPPQPAPPARKPYRSVNQRKQLSATAAPSSHFNDEMTSAAVSSSTLGGGHQTSQGQYQDQRQRGSDRDRIRYARHYAYDTGNYYDRPSKATSLNADTNTLYDGRSKEHTWPLVERGRDRGRDVDVSNNAAMPAIQQNFVRMSYPPEPAVATAFSASASAASPSSALSSLSSPVADLYSYNAGGVSSSASGAEFQSDRNRYQDQQQQPSNFLSNNYASSYQYKIQH
ncbi:uncharacterized protein LOC135834875 [Planococcus citri]|uniref:uncharacterized protein LOC135834875 n=1 Tax=Planococcus citri TaxID=170843 RepID=UPI0031F8E8FC